MPVPCESPDPRSERSKDGPSPPLAWGGTGLSETGGRTVFLCCATGCRFPLPGHRMRRSVLPQPRGC
eukprot:1012862-Alexandrium_andersonii.AAC.1